jgi:photosystem II stability/assembly factor-like uncharacterized protein
MKKKLLPFFALGLSSLMAQTQSPDWTTIQNTNFPLPSAGVRYLDAVDANVVWATGYDGMAPSRNYNWFTNSVDGGTTFTSGNVFPDTSTYVVASIEGIDATTAYVTAFVKSTGNKGVVYKTTSGGTSWANTAAVNMYTAAASFANITCFTDALTGITMGDPVSGEYEIHRTTDAGATWTKIPGANIPNPLNTAEYGLTGVYTKNGNDIWYGTNNGRVYHSADAGLTWTVGTITGATVGVSKLAFRDNLNGLCIAYSGSAAAPVTGLYVTADGGLTWTQIAAPANFGENDICRIPGTTMYASCGAGTGNTLLSYTTDDGQNWTDWGSIDIQYLQIDFVDNVNGWAASFADPANASVGGMFKYSGLATSFAPLAEKMNFTIMPNPSNGLVNIILPVAKSGLTINVLDALGKVVYSEVAISTTVGDKKQLNLDFLPKGLYTINLKTATENSFSKIVLQ